MATVRTLVPTVLMRIDRAHIQELLHRADPVIQYIMNLLLERFRSTYPLPKKPLNEQAAPEDQLSPPPTAAPIAAPLPAAASSAAVSIPLIIFPYPKSP
jgi:hypothetical protein